MIPLIYEYVNITNKTVGATRNSRQNDLDRLSMGETICRNTRLLVE